MTTKKAIQHESGRITLIEGSNIKLKITEASGKEDKPIREIAVGGVTDKEFKKMMEKPGLFNLERFGKKEIKK